MIVSGLGPFWVIASMGARTLLLHDYSCYSDCRICRHLLRAEATSFKPLLSQLRGAV